MNVKQDVLPKYFKFLCNVFALISVIVYSKGRRWVGLFYSMGNSERMVQLDGSCN